MKQKRAGSSIRPFSNFQSGKAYASFVVREQASKGLSGVLFFGGGGI
jgi:hypothetical protein